MLVKEAIKHLKNLDPNDEIWITWLSKDELINNINEYGYTDENDNPIQVDRTIVTNSFAHDIWRELDTDDYLWERFNDSYSDTITEQMEKYIKENSNEVSEVEVEQIEKELWD